jgi:hypothetical protein
MTRTTQDVEAELLGFVARAGLWVVSARAAAADSIATGELMTPELAEMEGCDRASGAERTPEPARDSFTTSVLR